VSSIYDALRRIQGDKGTWTAPLERREPPSETQKKKMTVWIIAFAVIASSVCTAGVFYGLRMMGAESEKPAAAVTSPAPAPGAGPQASPKTAAAQPAPPVRAAAPAQPAQPPVESIEGYLKAGDGYFEAKDYANALLTYTKALHYFGKDIRILNNIGSVYLAQGQPDKAIHYFKESNSISKDYVEPVYNLACAYARLGDTVKAVLNLRKACTMNPEAKIWAASDPDLMSLKGNRDFDRLIGAQ